MDVGPDGNLWFAEVLGNRIGRITTDGAITEFLVPTPNSRPTVVAAGPDGNLWFTERGTVASPGNKVGRITPEGAITEYTLPNPGSRPLGITAGPDGNVWFTEQAGNRIGRIDPATGIDHRVPAPEREQPAVGDHGRARRQPLVHRVLGQPDRPDHPRRDHQRVPGADAGSQPNTIRRGPDLNPGDNCAYQQETLGEAAFAARYGSFGGCVARLATTKTLWFTETAGNRVAAGDDRRRHLRVRDPDSRLAADRDHARARRRRLVRRVRRQQDRPPRRQDRRQADSPGRATGSRT